MFHILEAFVHNASHLAETSLSSYIRTSLSKILHLGVSTETSVVITLEVAKSDVKLPLLLQIDCR